MKTKILVSALICASVGYVNADTRPPSTQKEKVMSEIPRTDKMKKNFSNKDEPIDSMNFDTKSKAEQDQYINDSIGRRNESFSKFNLVTLQEPNLLDNELKIKEEKINEMLVQCAKLIGSEEWEEKIKRESSRNYDFFNDKPLNVIIDDFEGGMSVDFRRRVHVHYLSNRMFKCVRYLYIKPTEEILNYQIDDFEYKRVLSAKEKKVEKLYEKIYLAVKEAGLLRKMQHAYYPKSLLRKHADKTGLTDFIKQQENLAKNPLKHDELAGQFFGLREAWLVDLHKYFEQLIGNKKEIVNDGN